MTQQKMVSWERWLRRIGTSGALLGATVLVVSMVLRLESNFDPDGMAVSALSAGLEQGIRLLHRLAASGVALLALAAAVLCWMRRATSRFAWIPSMWVALATLVLSVIGPMTPGYRIAFITVANVGLGVVLVMAFWWLREVAGLPATRRGRYDGFQRTALLAFVLHAATGAATSAAMAQGGRLPLSLALWLVLAGAAWLQAAGGSSRADWRHALLALVALQTLTGYLSMSPDSRDVKYLLAHALLTPVLAMVLVSLAVSSAAQNQPLRVGAGVD